jgi:hypothetical protein
MSAPDRPQSAPQSDEGVGLIEARNATPISTGVPNITVTADSILVNGVSVGDPRELAREGRLKRVDGVYITLKGLREQWKTSHPGEAFPGMVVLRITPEASSIVVNSVFQTAAFAGYPNESFLVANPSLAGGKGLLPLSAQVPVDPRSSNLIGLHPPDGNNPRPPTLQIDARQADKFVLNWKLGATVVSTLDVPAAEAAGRGTLRYALLADKLASEWNARGGHRAASDRDLDQAVISLGNDAPFQRLIGVLDAILSVRRDCDLAGRLERIPVFDVTLSLH